MGLTKRLLEEEDSRGWRGAPGDHFVCGDCFEEDEMKSFIEEQATETACSYCLAEAEEPIAVATDVVLAHIAESLRAEFGNPDDECVPYDSAEGGYQHIDVMDTDQLLEHLMFGMTNDAIRLEVRKAFQDLGWVPLDPFGLPQHEALKYGWDDFKKAVKYRSRFVFAMQRRRRSVVPSETPEPADMLPLIAECVSEAALVRRLPAGTTLYRARDHNPAMQLRTAKDLGTAPRRMASANRMSPAGIPMFYGADDADTAVEEVREHCSIAGQDVTIGAFTLARDCDLIDLSRPLLVPSLFDAQRRHRRSSIRFLQGFVDDVSRPVASDGREHVEYVPTQVVTEYFRRIFRTASRGRVRGILYPSACTGRPCCVLFFENRQCCDVKDGWQADEKRWLALAGVQTRRL